MYLFGQRLIVRGLDRDTCIDTPHTHIEKNILDDPIPVVLIHHHITHLNVWIILS